MQLRPYGAIWPALLPLRTPTELREEIFFLGNRRY